MKVKKTKNTKAKKKTKGSKSEEPMVKVIKLHVQPENPRNGFFELDWNEYFIKDLLKAGYGEEADPEEEVVDRWFRDIVYNMLEAEGQSTDRGAGYINVVPISKGKSSVE